jgi:histidinol phosphatase-like enzyme
VFHEDAIRRWQDGTGQEIIRSAYEINVAQSVVIGDTYDDLAAAQALGMSGCLVRTGWGEHTIQERQAGCIASYIATDILEAARWVTTRDTGQATDSVERQL